jgi:peptide/nickel transport system substrate-binding protein
MTNLRICLCALLALAAAPAGAETVLRVVPQSDLRVLDPHVTQATVTRIYGLMIYDQLYAMDEGMRPHPEMVGARHDSADGLSYEFTLRDGLKFHTGQPVTSADVIASVPRAAKQDPLMQLMMKRMTRFEAVDAHTFRMTFAKPFPLIESALAASDAFIMRAEDIAAAGDKPITATDGSGPFRFDAAGYIPGAHIMFDRNADYVPRDEPADGLAGGKRVKVDKVEWIVIPDLQTRIGALEKGEVDLLDQLPHDGVQSLDKRKDIAVEVISPLGNMAFLRYNTLFPPFNDVRARQALALVVNQRDYLAAAFTTDQRWWSECYSWFGCGTPNETEVGSEPYRKPDLEKAKILMQQAGYHGQKIVILTTQEIPLIDALAQVTASELRSIGVDVDVATSDWGTLVVRRARQNSPETGGWSIFDSGADITALAEPATNILIDMRCDRQNYVGWPCSEQAEAMRTDLIDNPSHEKLEAYSQALWTELPSLLLGKFLQPIAYRRVISGLPHGQTLVFWNVEKTGP